MHISHDPVVMSYAGNARIARAANIQRAKLADSVAIANMQFARLASIFFVLWNSTNRIELEDMVVFANRGATFNHTMRADTCASAYRYVRPNNAVGANFNAAV